MHFKNVFVGFLPSSQNLGGATKNCVNCHSCVFSTVFRYLRERSEQFLLSKLFEFSRQKYTRENSNKKIQIVKILFFGAKIQRIYILLLKNKIFEFSRQKYQFYINNSFWSDFGTKIQIFI